MTELSSKGKKWWSATPGRAPAVIGVILVAVVAFFLGGLFLGDGSSPEKVGVRNGESAEATSPEAHLWTCSMHPQIQLPEPGKCPICFMDLIPVESDGDEDLDPRQIRMSETAKKLAQIQTSVVRRGFAEHEVRMVGKISYDETSVAYITAWVPGRLDRLYADYTGITVNKGDHMVYMYSPELLAAQEELLQAKAAVASLSDTRSEMLKSTADATLAAAREKLRLHGLTSRQVSEIESSGEPSDHLTVYAPMGGVVVKKDALEGMYVDTGTRIYTIADLSKLWVQFEAYESDLPWLRYGQRVRFTSPSFPGESFEAAISFIDPVVDPKTRTVDVRAIVENIGLRLKPGMFVRGVLNSRVNAEGKVISEDLAGKWISPMHPEVLKDGPGTCDVCGMTLVPVESLGYADPGESRRNAPLLIPDSAPLITGERAVVYVELPSEEGPLFEGREVELGPRAGEFYVVKSGLQEGGLVVTNGAFKIDSELQIRAKPSMMSPSGGTAGAGHDHGEAPRRAEGMEPEEVSEATERLPESAEVMEDLSPVYGAYFEVQMALAEDNHSDAKSAAARLKSGAAEVNMGAFSGEGHRGWMEILVSLRSASEGVMESEGIAAARDEFFHLSSAVIELHDTFGHRGDKPYYQINCSMARDNAGADWLQTEKTVWNPYYGETMLRCGEVMRELPSVREETE
jgi:Cu(I)/Ag(I) efflux system membrane fusion protein